MKRLLLTVCVVFLIAIAMSANASTITSLAGDKDGFGLSAAPAVPSNGTLWRDDLGGIFFSDYRGAGDLATAPFTDVWTSGPFSYVHNYTLGGMTALSATLAIQIAGVHDINQGLTYDVLVDGMSVGTIAYNANNNGFQEVQMYSFNVPVSLIDGSNTISVDVSYSDGYSVNFSELTMQTSAVPEPASLLLIGLGLGGLVGVKKKLTK